MVAKSELIGDFSIRDVLREAASRSIEVAQLKELPPLVDTPTMSGTIKAEAVRDGLFMSGYDLTYLADSDFTMEMNRSVFCGLLLDGQSAPLAVEEQVAVIYAGTRGYLDGVATADVGRFESELLARLHSKHQDILDTIRTSKELKADTEAKLKEALEAFAKSFA